MEVNMIEEPKLYQGNAILNAHREYFYELPTEIRDLILAMYFIRTNYDGRTAYHGSVRFNFTGYFDKFKPLRDSKPDRFSLLLDLNSWKESFTGDLRIILTGASVWDVGLYLENEMGLKSFQPTNFPRSLMDKAPRYYTLILLRKSGLLHIWETIINWATATQLSIFMQKHGFTSSRRGSLDHTIVHHLSIEYSFPILGKHVIPVNSKQEMEYWGGRVLSKWGFSRLPLKDVPHVFINLHSEKQDLAGDLNLYLSFIRDIISGLCHDERGFDSLQGLIWSAFQKRLTKRR